MPLSGRVFLVAGATSGIGLACSREIIRRGGHVFGIGRRTEHPLDGVESYTAIIMDLEEQESFDKLRRLLTQNSSISDLICAIGRGEGAIGDFEQLSMPTIEASLNVNLLGPIRFLRATLPHLRKSDGGDVFVLGSEASLRGAKRGSLYAAAKFALRGLIQSLRAEYGRYGVRVVGVYPGMTRTPFFEPLDFEPGEDDSHAILPEDIALLIADVAASADRIVVDELTLSPRQHVIKPKRRKK